MRLIVDFSLFLMVCGFIGFLFMISPGMRKMLKRNRKLEKRKNRIKEDSKARDFQI